MSEETDVLRVCEAITEGNPVDWARETAARPELKDTLDRLRVVEAVAAAHRSAPDGQRVEANLPKAGQKGVPVTQDRSMPSLPFETWGHLRLLEKLGEGAFGEVYRAFDESLRVHVALKLLKDTVAASRPEAKRFLEEGQRLARVRHPNVLVVHGVGEHQGRLGLWMDLVEGNSLEALLQQQGPFGAREAAGIGIDLCHALAAVHRAGLVHRDVKTSNVAREKGGRIILLDFGSGGNIPGEGEASPGGTIYGTPLAMAPEQLCGEAPKPTTDIYALGVLLYRLVTGHYPVEASRFEELYDKIVNGNAVPLRDRRPDLPSEFVHGVERAIDPKPERRYRSAGEMERALEAVAGRSGPREESGAKVHEGVRWRLAALVAGVVLVAVIALLWPRGKPEPFSSPATPNAGTATAPEKPAPLTATATLYRLRGETEKALLPGARVSVGDTLFLKVRPSTRAYVYVLDEDEAGRVYILFPSPDLDLKNPLTGDAAHRLPGSLNGKQVNWGVSSAAGRENITVLASTEALAELEHELARFPHASLGRPAEVRPESVLVLRGIGSLVTKPTAPTGQVASRVESVIRRSLAGRAEDASDLWTWQIQLENPR